MPREVGLFGRLAAALAEDWSLRARASQLPPTGDWNVWLLLAGRGWGKTLSGAQWTRGEIEQGRAQRVALVAPTAADARDVMIEGPSGLLVIAPTWNRPIYEPTRRRLTWPNGAIATAFSAEEAERLRGPQHDAAWVDELAAWRDANVWDMLQLGLRIGAHPRCVVTTTPKPTKLIRQLVAREGHGVVITRGATRENAANLAPGFLEAMEARYQGTRLGRQELDAELLEDVPGALWTIETLERTRVAAAPPMKRVVVAIDPAGGTAEGSDETGIIVAGCDAAGNGFVLADLSGRYAPTDWARKAIAAYRQHQADRIVAERNYGGDMVEATLRAVDATVSFKAVVSSRGKVLRAEPVAALYEQGKVHHIGVLAALEDQQIIFTNDFSRASAGFSPDRVDALVFALTELMVKPGVSDWDSTGIVLWSLARDENSPRRGRVDF